MLNLGSAVVLPEVFLKALTIARNLGDGRPTHFLAADFDMQRHYRPRLNVVQRPTRAGGEGYLLTGHHELLLPLLVWGVLEELGRAEAAAGGQASAVRRADLPTHATGASLRSMPPSCCAGPPPARLTPPAAPRSSPGPGPPCPAR